MRQANTQVGILVHYPAENKGGEGNGPVGQIADGVRQMVTVQPGADQGISALMYQDDGAGLLGNLPHRKELRVIKGLSVNVVADHRPAEPQLSHGPLQFGGGSANILHRQVG